MELFFVDGKFLWCCLCRILYINVHTSVRIVFPFVLIKLMHTFAGRMYYTINTNTNTQCYTIRIDVLFAYFLHLSLSIHISNHDSSLVYAHSDLLYVIATNSQMNSSSKVSRVPKMLLTFLHEMTLSQHILHLFISLTTWWTHFVK